jgi:hypothetical protein
MAVKGCHSSWTPENGPDSDRDLQLNLRQPFQKRHRLLSLKPGGTPPRWGGGVIWAKAHKILREGGLGLP